MEWITEEFLRSKGFVIDKFKDDVYAHLILKDKDIHIKMQYNPVYNYWTTECQNFLTGYAHGYSETTARIRYVDEFELFYKLVFFLMLKIIKL